MPLKCYYISSLDIQLLYLIFRPQCCVIHMILLVRLSTHLSFLFCLLSLSFLASFHCVILSFSVFLLKFVSVSWVDILISLICLYLGFIQQFTLMHFKFILNVSHILFESLKHNYIVSLNSLSGILSECVSFGTIFVWLVLLGIILIILSWFLPHLVFCIIAFASWVSSLVESFGMNPWPTWI